jgi:hypothetical protein
MAVSFKILPDLGLVYTRYEGRAAIADSLDAFRRYAAHPDAVPGQTHFVDLSRITEIERDHAAMMMFQAEKLAYLLKGPTHPVMIYYAPGDLPYQFARMTQRSWDGVDGATVIVQRDEAQAMEVLGLGIDRLEALLSRAS